jgi:alkaline phosphatase D
MRSLCLLGALQFVAMVAALPPRIAFASEVFLTHGPLIGAVTATSARIWVRTNSAAIVEVEYSTSPEFVGSILSPDFATAEGSDLTGQIKISALAPERVYFYRLWANGIALPGTYHFTTAPRKSALKTFSFAVLSDFRVEAAPVYASVASENPAFVIFLGDLNHSTPSTLLKMRAMHRTMRGNESAAGRDFIAHIRPFPFYHVWDDHGFGMDNADKTFPGKADALKAFREYFPTPFLPSADGIWHKFQYAQAEFFMLDLRSQRDPSEAPDGPNKSILGAEQKKWLQPALLGSTARWKFLMSTVSFNPGAKPNDSRAAFRTERAELVSFIHQNEVRGVIAISGDLHTGGALDNGANSGFPELSVPHANIPPCSSTTSCRCNTGGASPGIWSEGILCGIDHPRYGLIIVSSDSVVLQIKGDKGDLRFSLTINE